MRLFAGFAGFGAASVNLAVSSSLFAAAGTGGPWLTSLAMAAALWAVTLLAWTVAALRNGNFPLPRTSSAALQAAAALHVLAIVAGARGDAAGLNLSHLAALLLTLMIIAAKAWLGRQPAVLAPAARTRAAAVLTTAAARAGAARCNGYGAAPRRRLR